MAHRGAIRSAAIGAAVAVGLGCSGLTAAVSGTPPPPAHQDLVGHWTAPTSTLVITADGFVDYERHSGGINTEINGGITRWKDDGFVVFGLSEFHVEEAPHRTSSGWETTIDGITYPRSP